MAAQMGQWLQEHEDDVLAEIRAAEPLPDETRVVCASLDGVNVLLGEPGKKKGRPNERPHEGSSCAGPAPADKISSAYEPTSNLTDGIPCGTNINVSNELSLHALRRNEPAPIETELYDKASI